MTSRSRPTRGLLAATLASLLLAGCGGSAPEPAAAPAEPAKTEETRVAAAEDPYLWLEDVEGEKALDWVRAQNAASKDSLESLEGFAQLRDDLRAILDSNDKIPFVREMGGYLYNFWQDANNPRGLWRRTTLDSYRSAAPQWEVILDLDALNKAEGENWVWAGADCLRPEYTRCLLSLSRGGADANVTREFDVATKSFVEGGFFRPEAKGGMGWIDLDTVFVYTDFGDGSMTSSGYPRIAKRWKRGTELASAETVYEGQADDMYIAASHDDTPGYERSFVSRTLAFYNDELYLIGDGGTLTRIDAPNSANKSVHKDWLLLELREPLTVAEITFAAGSLLAAKLDAFLAGERRFTVLFEPSDTTSLAGYSFTANHLVLNVLEDVKNRLSVLTPAAEAGQPWASQPLPGAPAFGTVSVSAYDEEKSDLVWMTSTDYLTPTTLYLGELLGEKAKLKEMPSFFDKEGLEITQGFATSDDGTRVPYFMVARKGMERNGKNPTLLYGYGGFEISLTPGYSGAVGRAWLQDGGVYVVANIRGGGEYGPRWHQAALKANRNKAYEDFAAVAKELIAQNITAPAHLGMQGGSNGGLLMGNMTVMYPELFGAVVCQVPLLDMKRYHLLLAGASWMAEYGNPDTADWEFLQKYSPYQNVKADAKYPPVLFTTSTRDDRVHPGHARKMFARMQEQGHSVAYYENIEGGHGGAADNGQRAYMQAIAYSFLRQHLFPKG
ncbi:prolyl oligopeptidase family serine peptidase [Aquimonas voraii]|uniref:Prolyl oligopeptidase n=1 Tax=Aquimonas voraii TaxID=265719 RepID=A0A1G7A4K4_9GAMM|nr:prolyl oligopeptidase [Aquimonas voraii]